MKQTNKINTSELAIQLKNENLTLQLKLLILSQVFRFLPFPLA